MLLFRSIIKLQVNISKGETIINYDDQTTRRISRHNCGFAFDYKRSLSELNCQTSGTVDDKPTERLSSHQTNFLNESGSRYVLKALSPTQANMEAIKSDADADSETHTVVLIDKNTKFNASNSSDSESTAFKSANDVAVSYYKAEVLKEQFDSIGLDETVAQMFTDDLHPSQHPTGRTRNLTVIRAIMPELINTDVEKEDEEDCDRTERVSYFCAPNRLVTWHLSTCIIKDCKVVPICTCLKIKEKISELREMLHIFLGPGSTFGPIVDQQHFIIEFVQSFDNIKSHLQVLCELLVHHILYNANQGVHNRNVFLQNRTMNN